MPATPDAVSPFTRKHAAYGRFIRLVGYPQGLRVFFLRSSLLNDRLRVLDAGCGTGVFTLALHEAVVGRRFAVGTLHAFDLTPAMLERFGRELDRGGVSVEIRQADVRDSPTSMTGANCSRPFIGLGSRRSVSQGFPSP